MTDPVPPGGPAAINGFLYQLLANLGHAVRGRIAQARDDSGGSSITIVLEPGAGDARVEGDAELLV